MMENVN